jgi:hypothetical protein
MPVSMCPRTRETQETHGGFLEARGASPERALHAVQQIAHVKVLFGTLVHVGANCLTALRSTPKSLRLNRRIDPSAHAILLLVVERKAGKVAEGGECPLHGIGLGVFQRTLMRFAEREA